MGRNKVSRNISKDEERGLYYVCLNHGKDANGKYIKTYVTTTNKASAKEILKKHGARFGALSTENVGSTFWFELGTVSEKE